MREAPGCSTTWREKRSALIASLRGDDKPMEAIVEELIFLRQRRCRRLSSWWVVVGVFAGAAGAIGGLWLVGWLG
jgi:hypothetical protein